MTNKQLKEFISFLIKEGDKVYGSVIQDDIRLAKRIYDPGKLVLDGQLTYYSWRKFFLPARETLFNIYGDYMRKIKVGSSQVLIGLTVLDLRALDLYNQVFSSDVYFQERKRSTIVVGQSMVPSDKREYGEFQDNYLEDTLEHLEFDIFLEKVGEEFKVFTGSEDGQRLLEKFGYRDYENVKYVGPIREEGLDEEMLEIKKKLESEYNNKLWQDLGKRCLACGKCSLVCPTCYCFNMTDRSKVKATEGRRVREWTTCFYSGFSRLAGDHRFLTDAERKIYYWYEHKFVRDPEKYNVPGCVRCGRCIKTCPANINIMESIKRIKSGQ